MIRIESLAYIVAQSTDVAKWKHYGEQVLGMSTSATSEGGLFLKMDERSYRISVTPGPEDRYYASGWEVRDEAAYADALAALARAGVAVEAGDAKLVAARQVQALSSFSDPSGNRHEISWGYTGPTAPFASPIGVEGFKTGKQGIGHTVLPAAGTFDATLKFFQDVFGFGLSDVFNFQMGPDAPVIRIYFLHAASGRHHSLALAEMPNPAGCVHAMVEVNTMTDVGLAYDRVQKQGVKMMATLGEHENDRMTSFYVMTPGNFAIEYGYGGINVDPATWQTTQTKQVSIWGHDFSVGFR
ncbi:biphenyl 2,3-dioxygenase [Solimonas sp. K1W22B-7]|uniref:VOC family protein n=1 Tax=Solimonas sp. K1W22B-7 TaxID=2303331 RepID=UPI000E336FCD|nr:VOC family protein [Solimonas sp. K1W22B-7]AXQ28122.1 biphenyl 2,3-dioxygenase [Solimonas sp. K1W22B-7]